MPVLNTVPPPTNATPPNGVQPTVITVTPAPSPAQIVKSFTDTHRDAFVASLQVAAADGAPSATATPAPATQASTQTTVADTAAAASNDVANIELNALSLLRSGHAEEALAVLRKIHTKAPDASTTPASAIPAVFTPSVKAPEFPDSATLRKSIEDGLRAQKRQEPKVSDDGIVSMVDVDAWDFKNPDHVRQFNSTVEIEMLKAENRQHTERTKYDAEVRGEREMWEAGRHRDSMIHKITNTGHPINGGGTTLDAFMVDGKVDPVMQRMFKATVNDYIQSPEAERIAEQSGLKAAVDHAVRLAWNDTWQVHQRRAPKSQTDATAAQAATSTQTAQQTVTTASSNATQSATDPAVQGFTTTPGLSASSSQPISLTNPNSQSQQARLGDVNSVMTQLKNLKNASPSMAIA